MPKSSFKNPFVRRRSSGNVLQSTVESAEPAQSSFKVLERPDKRTTIHGTDRRAQSQVQLSQGQAFNSPIHNLRGKSADDLGSGTNRGSGGTTNSGSSGYFVNSSSASARYSSTSTLPSSLDQDRDRERDRERDEELFPKKAATMPMHHSPIPPMDHTLPAPPSFSSRASRAFSFGLKSKQAQQQLQQPAFYNPQGPSDGPSQSATEPQSPARERAMTTSSYASTAVPPRLDPKPDLGVTDFGGDFDANMFSSIQADDSQQRKTLSPPPSSIFHRTESEPMFPPKSYSRQGLTPSPNQNQRRNIDRSESPYSYDGRSEQDGLFSSSNMSSPVTESAPMFAPTGSSIAPAFLGGSKQGYALVPERYTSPGFEQSSRDNRDGFVTLNGQGKQLTDSSLGSSLGYGDRAPKRVELKDPQQSTLAAQDAWRSENRAGPSSLGTRAQTQTGGITRNDGVSPGSSEAGSLWGNESKNTTPRAARLQPSLAQDDSLFDISPSGPPSRAMRPAMDSRQFTANGTPKRMTKAQFDLLQRRGDSSGDPSEEDTHSGDDYDDDDDVERAKKATTQRRKQEANMAVYRQQMKKSTGGGPADLPAARSGHDGGATGMLSSLHLGGVDGAPPADTLRGKRGDSDDEDVPLGILQAHGFPGGARAPSRQGEGNGSVVNGGAGQGNLPPFARRLPQDPYYGAGLNNPPNRESLAFSSTASAYGAGTPHLTPMGNPMPMPGGHPGGLVGVIASEESAKAARRGSPNAQGGYSMPLPANMPPRTMSMGNVAHPSMFPGGMPMMPGMQMPMMPPGGDAQSQQMQQFMAMQMQLMQNMMAMQSQIGQGLPPQMSSAGSFAPPGMQSRPMSMASQAPPSIYNMGPSQGRSMTMLNPPPNWGNLAPQQQQQRPNSVQPLTQSNYAPSVQGLNMYGGTPGYTPSIAPSERSNVGMPSRYRPVQTGDGSAGRSQSMTSSLTLNALQNQQPVAVAESRNTIRIVEKAKGAKAIPVAKGADEDEDEGWAEMAKKRNESKWKWGKKKESKQQPLGDLYQNFE